MTSPYGTLTLIGSGEFGEGMGRVYRAVLARAPSEPRAVFLDTPAGFELNSDTIAAKATDYFSKRLNLDLQVASYKNKERASARDLEAALRVPRHADFIFAGPGSPSYTIHHWQGSQIWKTIRERFAAGAHLVFASAAAIAIGSFALPVYEIYRAGQDLHWLDGLNLLAALRLNLAVIPHWNNAEGGTYDTRFCFMGQDRLEMLERQLSRDTVVLGIDEHTACIFDAAAQECSVMGAGSVTIRCDGAESAFASGETFPFDQLRSGTRTPVKQDAQISPDTLAYASPDQPTRYLLQVARALDETDEPDVKRELLDRAHDTMHELSADWIDNSHLDAPVDIAPYIDLLIELRRKLREIKQYALADEIRSRLAALHIVLQDDTTGTTWHKA